MCFFLLLCVSFSKIYATHTQMKNDTYLSTEIKAYCALIGYQYDICPELLMAMIEKESSGRPTAVNESCKGLMQINDSCHRQRMNDLNVTDVYDAYGNILVGADYLHELLAECEEISYALDRYNGNSKAAYNFENGILSDYSKWILERSAELERLHGK